MSGFGVILGHYVRRALTYRWLVLVPAVLVFALVTLNVTVQPDIYESYAVLMPPISRPANGSPVDGQVEANMFRSATERLLSTKSLTEVAEKLDPYPQIRETRGMEGVIEKLRENVRVEINPTAGSITVIASHSMGDRPAEMAADMVNTLTGAFIKSQREALDDNAAKAEQFLLQEKVRYRRDLDRARNAVEEFRAKHPGELPEDVETNKLAIERATQSIVDNRQNQRLFQGEARRLQGELALRETEINRLRENGDASGAAAVQASERLLDSLKAEIAQLLVTYDESHETVKKRRAYMAAVEAQTEQLRQQAHSGSAMDQIALIQFTVEETKKQQKRAMEDAAAIDDVIANLQKSIEAAEQRNLTASKLEVQYTSLKRDVEDLEGRYTGVETRLADAQYRRKYGEYDSTTPILVEQSGFVPARPARPDRLLTSAIGILVGFGIGIGLAVTRYKLNATYQQAEDLRALMPGAVLVTIPEVHTSGVRVGRAIAGVLGGLVLAGIFAGTVAILGIQLGWWGDPSMIRALINLR
jgi:succinoglycan biosynthesis transport protein ExoP